MSERTAGARRLGSLVLIGGAVAIAAACESLTGPGEPEEVSFRIDSEDVSEVEVVTSMFFLRVPDPECPEDCPPHVELVEADTTTRSVPFQQTLEFTARQQVFIATFPTVDEPATLSMRVDIDGRNWYDDSRQLAPGQSEDGERETLSFVYQFGGSTLN